MGAVQASQHARLIRICSFSRLIVALPQYLPWRQFILDDCLVNHSQPFIFLLSKVNSKSGSLSQVRTVGFPEGFTDMLGKFEGTENGAIEDEGTSEGLIEGLVEMLGAFEDASEGFAETLGICVDTLTLTLGMCVGSNEGAIENEGANDGTEEGFVEMLGVCVGTLEGFAE